MQKTKTQTYEPWITTFSHKKFHFLNPSDDEICIEDIAHALSNLCRFNGHCQKFRSVASHSIDVATICPPHLKIYGLMHDAAEAYVCDIPRPVKPFLSNYSDIEHNIMEAISRKFGLNIDWFSGVHEYDMAILAAEAGQLMDKDYKLNWTGFQEIEPADIKIISDKETNFDYEKYFINLFNFYMGHTL